MEAAKMTKLETDECLPGVVGSFGLLLPTDLDDEAFAIVKEQLEFRRKCMNQGFDNLIHLLEMHFKTLQRTAELRKAGAVNA